MSYIINVHIYLLIYLFINVIKSETSMPEIQDNSLIPKSVENNSSGNNNSNTNNISNNMNNNNINSSNSNNMSMMNKLSKKKIGIEKTGMDSKHILGKVSKTSKNIMKIPSKYPQSKSLYSKNKNSIGMGSGSSGSTTISNETTVMTSGQVGSLSSHYQNVNSPLYSLSHPSSNSSLNQSSNNSSNTSGGKCCTYCGAKTTPTWRRGPEGTGTLCNACGVKWRNGKILTNDPPTNTKMNMGKHEILGSYGSDSLQSKQLNNNNNIPLNMKK